MIRVMTRDSDDITVLALSPRPRPPAGLSSSHVSTVLPAVVQVPPPCRDGPVPSGPGPGPGPAAAAAARASGGRHGHGSWVTVLVVSGGLVTRSDGD